MSKTQEEIEKELNVLKVTYPKSYTFTITNDDNTETTIIMKKMDRTIYERSLKISEKSGIDAAIYLIDQLWIGGDDKKLILNDDENIIVASQKLAGLYNFKSAELKKN
jgi:hypothetical protein